MLAPWEQRVAVDQVRRRGTDRRDFVTTLERSAVQCLDIREDLVHRDPAGVDVAARQPEEHERVVGVRAMSNRDSCLCHR